MHDFLSKIIQEKRDHLEKLKQLIPDIESKAKSKDPHKDTLFKDALSNQKKFSLIAEIKKSSPSKGLIRKDFNPVSLAKAYEGFGADALSVLTEASFFEGDVSHIKEVSGVVALPILRKDFIIDSYQIYESFLIGARAILLIAAILTEKELDDFILLAQSLGIDCLVEVHNKEELGKAINTSAEIIGVNNRNLRTLDVSLDTSKEIIPLIPKDKIIVAESGIATREDMVVLEKLGVDAVLVGEALLKSDNIEIKIKELMAW